MRRKLLLIAPFAIVAIVVFIAIGGEIVRLLWNWLLPPLFGWREITFWQALGLLALCRILFGGFRLAGGGPRVDMRRRMVDRMADRIAERWERMTPEERERFRQRMRERVGFDPATGSAGPFGPAGESKAQ
jgi:hypothetical protein